MRTQTYVKTAVPGISVPVDKKRKAVRLHHPTLRNCIWTIQQPAVVYPVPFACPMCGIIHIWKTFHMNLDANGNVAVHPEIYELFKANGIVEELKATNEVTPRPDAIGMPGIDASSRPIHGFNPPKPPEVPVWQPPQVVSREQGIVKTRGVVIVNSITPPADRFRREPDGTWTDLERNPNG